MRSQVPRLGIIMADFQIQNADADVIKEILENEINFDTEFDIVVKDIGLECEQKTFSCPRFVVSSILHSTSNQSSGGLTMTKHDTTYSSKASLSSKKTVVGATVDHERIINEALLT